MEGGVAFLGQYEGEAFDQHNCPQEQATFDAGLNESVSFGRFAVDSLSWVKRSSFYHNQYLEELGNCSTPGSVRQKKAYFEAYYKAIAKRKALENALAEGVLEGHTDQNEIINVEDTSTKLGDFLIIETCGRTSSTLIHKTNDGMLQSSLASTCEESHSAEDLPKKQGFIAEDAEGLWESSHQAIQEMMPDSLPNPCVTLLPKDESEPNFIAESLQNAVVQITDELGAILQVESPESISIEEESADEKRTFLEFEGNIAQEDSDVYDVEVVDKFETNGSAGPELQHTSNQISVIDSVAAPEPTSGTRQQIQTPLQQSSKVKLIVLSDSSTLSKASNGSNSNRLEHKAESKRLIPVGSLHNVTVPQPFRLSTNKRSIVAQATQEQGGTRSSERPAPNGLSPLRKIQWPSKVDKKSSICRTVVDGNTLQKGKHEQRLRDLNLAKCDVIPNGLRKLGVTVSLKQDDKRPNGLADGSGRRSRPTPVRSNTRPFSLRTDERAEKRKQFNLKVEAKINAKEAERCQAEAKTKEEAEEEIKQLRRGLRFKATPIPEVYKESLQTKLEAKKARILTTWAKSPKLGQKSMATTERHVSPVFGLKEVSQTRYLTNTWVEEETTACVRCVRITSPLTEKSNGFTKLSEGLKIQPLGVEESGSSPHLDCRKRPDHAVGNDLETLLGPNLTEEVGQLDVDSKGVIYSNIHLTTRGQGHVEVSAASLEDPSMSKKEMAASVANRREKKPLTVKEHSREAISITKERSKKESLHSGVKIIPKRDATYKGAPRDFVRRASPAPCSGTRIQEGHTPKQCLEHTEGLDGWVQN